MNRLIAISLLLASCSGQGQDYSWFEDNWISDAETTLDVNPNFKDLDQKDLAVIREMYGKIRWEISDSTLHFIDDRYDQLVSTKTKFTINPIDEDSFEMVSEYESRIVWRAGSGFCTVLKSEHLANFEIRDDDSSLECFKSAGT